MSAEDSGAHRIIYSPESPPPPQPARNGRSAVLARWIRKARDEGRQEGMAEGVAATTLAMTCAQAADVPLDLVKALLTGKKDECVEVCVDDVDVTVVLAKAGSGASSPRRFVRHALAVWNGLRAVVNAALTRQHPANVTGILHDEKNRMPAEIACVTWGPLLGETYVMALDADGPHVLRVLREHRSTSGENHA